MSSFNPKSRKQMPNEVHTDNTSLRIDGNNVDMEYEVMSIANTETRYNTLTELTSRYFSGLKNVIREGH